MIPNNEFVLFCGAGISVSAPSNAPLWGPMRDAIIKMSIDRIIDNSARWDQPFPMRMEAFAKKKTLKEIAPEVLFHILHSSLAQDDFNNILDAIGLGTPNKNHRAIAELSANKKICAIITTNFDCYIEQSLDDKKIKYELISDEQDAELWNKSTKSGDKLALFKIHGSLHQKDSIIATLKQAGRSLSQQKASVLRELFSNRNVLIIGYSGHDYDIFPELFELIKEGVPSQVTISSRGSVRWPLIELLDKEKSDNIFSLEGITAEVLFEQIFDKHNIQRIHHEIRKCQNSSWEKHVNTTINRIPIPDLLMFFGNIALIIGNVEDARSPFFIIARDLAKDALDEQKSLSNIRKAAEAHAALARCYVYFGVSIFADKEIENARQRYVELGDEYTTDDERILWWCQTNGRAWLLANEGKLKDSEGCFLNSIEQAERFREQEGFRTIGDETLVDAYIGLGDVLSLQKKYQEAETVYNNALSVAEEFGSLWLSARADLALSKISEKNNKGSHAVHLDNAKRRLSFMGLDVESIINPLNKKRKVT